MKQGDLVYAAHQQKRWWIVLTETPGAEGYSLCRGLLLASTHWPEGNARNPMDTILVQKDNTRPLAEVL